MFKSKFYLAITALLFSTILKAQTITIDNAKFDLGAGNSYSMGGSIAIPINISGCFDAVYKNNTLTNKFRWQLYDSTTRTKVNLPKAKDSITAFYATFLNATLPTGLNPTHLYCYKVSASTVGSDSAITNTFNVSATSVTAMATPVDTNKILKSQYYYGFCDGVHDDGVNAYDSLNMYDSSTGSTTIMSVYDDYNQLAKPTINNVGGLFYFPIKSTKVGNKYFGAYYTIIVKTNSGSVYSTKAYHIINSSWGLDIKEEQKLGQLYNCKGDTIKAIVETRLTQDAHIQQNFPAAFIEINWNDQPIQYTTQCQILANSGIVNHLYANSACITVNKANFNVKATVTNPFNIINGPGLTGTCGSRASSSFDSYIFAKPKAKFSCDSVVCLNDTTTFINLSDPGQGPAAQGQLTVCSNLAKYRWDIFNNALGHYISTKSEAPKNDGYKFTLPTDAGYHDIRLIVDNGYGNQAPCKPDTAVNIICVDTATIQTAFVMDSAGVIKNDSIIGCVPTVKMINKTPRTFCLDSSQFKYIWQVYDATKPINAYNNSNALPACNNCSFKFGPGQNMNTHNPTLTFIKTGKYYVSLRVKGVCDTTARVLKYVESNGDLNVSFPYDSVFNNCTFTAPVKVSYDSTVPNSGLFDKNQVSIIKNKPNYVFPSSVNQSFLNYFWSVKPATGWQFIAGTSATSQYPQIQFNAKGVYTVTDTFKNTSCGGKTSANQIIVIEESPAITNVSTAVDTICWCSPLSVTGFDIDTAKNKDVIIHWSTVGGNYGTFSPNDLPYGSPGIMTPTFTPNNLACSLGLGSGAVFTYKMSVSSRLNKKCTTVDATRQFYMRRGIPTNDTTKTICSGDAVNYVTNAGLDFIWDVYSSVSVTGSTVGGSGGLYVNSIQDVLIGTPNGTVVYDITPRVGSCNGVKYQLTVNVRPSAEKPTITMNYPNNAPNYSMCGGQQVNIGLSTTNVTDSFCWKLYSVNGNASIQGLANNCGKGPITNLINNINPTDDVWIITNAVSQFGCKGEADSVKVTVTPSAPAAQVLGAKSRLLCDSNCVILKGNDSKGLGVGSWEIKSFSPATPIPPAVAITTIDDSTAQVCNLSHGYTYIFTYKITPGSGCKVTTDDISITNTDTLPTPNAGRDTVVCNANGTVKLIKLLGSTDKPIDSLNKANILWTYYNASGANNPILTDANKAIATLTITNPVYIDTCIMTIQNGACASKADTAIVRVYGKPKNGSIKPSPIMPNNRYCQGSTVNFQSVFDTVYAEMYRWYYTNYPISGPTTFINSNTNPLTISSLQNSIQLTGVFKSLGWDYGCKDSAFTNTYLVTIDSPSKAGIIKSNDTILCSPGSVALLKDSAYRGPNILWYKSTVASNIVDTLAGTGVQFVATINQTTWFHTIVKNGNCPADTSAPFLIFMPTSADAAKVGNDTAVCAIDTIRLIGNIPLSGKGYWTQVSGPINDRNTFPGTVTNPYVTTFDVNNNLRGDTLPMIANIKLSGTYQFAWAIENAGCTGSADTITIVKDPALDSNRIYIATGADTVCKGTSITINGLQAIGGNNVKKHKWYYSIDGGTNWIQAANNNPLQYSFTADTTVLIRRDIKSDSCYSSSNIIQIVVHTTIINNTITAPAGICTGNNSLTVNGSVPVGGNNSYSYTWDTVSGPRYVPQLWFNVNANTQNYNPNVVLTDTMYYRRIVTSGKCTDTSNTVKAIIYPDAKATFTTTSNDTSGCAPFPIPIYAAPLSTITTYDWYADSAGVRIPLGTGAGFPGYTFNKSLSSVKIVLIATSTLGCKTDSISKWYYTAATPIPGFTISADSGCAKISGANINTTTFSYTNTTQTPSLFSYIFDYGDQSGNVALSIAPYNPPNHSYPPSSTGLDTTYNTCITAMSPNCGTKKFCKTVRIRTLPHVIMSVTPGYQCSGSPVTFNDYSITGPYDSTHWNFGDNTYSNQVGSTSHTYTANSLTSYTACLIRGNECGVDSFCSPVVIAANTAVLNTGLVNGPKYKCAKDTFIFSSNSIGATSYIWDFGDATTSPTFTNGIHTVKKVYDKPGMYIVKLTGTTSCGSIFKYDTAFVYGTPKVAYNVQPNTAVCKGDTVRFNNTTDTFTTATWYHSDGSFNSVNYKVYPSSGAYSVYLVAERQHTLPIGGTLTCKDSAVAQTVTVRDSMPGVFTKVQTNVGCIPKTMQFDNTSNITTLPYSTNWTFGEPVPQTGNNNIVHTYNIVGTYNVNMVATNAAGCVYTATDVVNVLGPTGSLTHDTGYVCGATPVNFNIYGNFTDSVDINYGDGPSVKMKYTGSSTFQHIYLTGGTYNPIVTLINGNGCTYGPISFGTIRVDYVKAAYIDPIPQNNSVCGQATVTYNGTPSKVDQSPASAVYTWTIDGTSVGNIGQVITKVYTTTSTHTVTLKVHSISGCEDTTLVNTFNVLVHNRPTILNVTRVDTACVNQTIYYTANMAPSQDPIQQYIWDFAIPSNQQTTVNTTSAVYGTPGNSYFDRLIAATQWCRDTLVLPRLVINPSANGLAITPSPDVTICEGDNTTLVANGGGVIKFNWGPKDGTFIDNNTNTITVKPLDDTKYYVTGTNIYNCGSNTAEVLVKVIHPYTINVAFDKSYGGGNDTICKGDSIRLSATCSDNVFRNLTWNPNYKPWIDTIIGNTLIAKPTASVTYTVTGLGCNNVPITAVVPITVGDSFYVKMAVDTVTLQGGVKYPITPFYSDLLGSVVWTPASGLDDAHSPNPTATVAGDVCYTVNATSLYGCKAQDQICIIAFCNNTQVFIPNTFTPGHPSGTNTHFYVTGTGVKVKSFRVFNRWGQVVFERANYIPAAYKSTIFNRSDAWDGNFKGVVAPTDAYVYTCDVECANGTSYTYTGTVTLIK